MRLEANGIQAWIIDPSDDSEVEQFQPETVDIPTGQTCWIASELNKGFGIRWRNTDVFCQTASRVYVDGVECAGEIIMGPNLEATVSGRRTSGSAVSPFLFSPLNMTDDDEFLDAGVHKDLGLIKLEIWTVNMEGTKPFADLGAAPAESKIHERSKKAVPHQIKFGEPVAHAPRNAAIVEYLERRPLVTFTFKYRSLELLRANGIAPKAPSRKRNAAAGPSEDKNPKRVKKEGPSSPGEIIDLTRSESPEASGVIDL
ncbi:hypothetical protein C8R46DRAFT_1103402, partial [Mycena filopes]